MLVSITRPPIPLAAGTDPVIEALVNLMPDYSAGRRLHALYVNKVQAELPGNYSQLFGTGPAFRGVFFPGWQPDGLLGLTGDTGLDNSWWSNFSIAVLCQAIADMGSDIRGQMLTGPINADLGSFNAALRARSARVYANVLAATYEPLAALLRQVNRTTGKQLFHDSLLSNVINRQLWYQAGMWTSPDWEMFNQYAKYIALGASDAEVDTLIGELIAAGLPVPAVVNQQGWRSYSEELRDKPNIDLDDIRSQCAGPITASTYLPTYGGGMPARMPNGNCYEFTANSQPGTRYRRAPGGCCFTPGTRILNAAGEAVAIRDVKRGDSVLTRDGTATVAYVATPVRGERRLHRLTGGGPVFTGTHPFLNAAPPDVDHAPPTVLAVDPQALAWAVPTLSEDGIGRLAAGSLVLSRAAGSGRAPVVVEVAGVEEVTPTGADTYLYDLRLETRTGRRQDFWAGDGETFYLVSPEYPVLDQAGASLITAVALMEG
ncbi:MAG: hypothetical protein JO144_08855, partial [Actinobacteria bacterium]|nr:hypothetical protein [Actinomycetota bacterium]